MTWSLFLAWLFGLPIAQRFLAQAIHVAREATRELLDPTSELTEADLLAAEALLRKAHGYLDMAIWLRACAIAGLPYRRGVRCPPLFFGRRAPTRDTLLDRAIAFFDRVDRMELSAHRRARQLLDGSRALSPSASPAQAGAQTLRAKLADTPLLKRAPRADWIPAGAGNTGKESPKITGPP